jgi:hypothetical protein
VQLIPEDKGGPEASDRDQYGQNYQHPIGSFGFLSGSIPPVQEPMEESGDQLGWRWWFARFRGCILAEIGALMT